MKRSKFAPTRVIFGISSLLRDVRADYEVMYVDSIASDTTAYCKRPHWPGSILLPVRAGSTTRYMMPGQRVIVRWEDGYGQRRFIDSRSRAKGFLEGEGEIVETVDWFCEGANFGRSYSFTAAAWNYAESTEAAGLAEQGGDYPFEIAFPRFRDGMRAWFVPRYFIEGEEDSESGLYADSDAPEGYVAAGPFIVIGYAEDEGFLTRRDLRPLLDGTEETDLDWTTFEGLSVCISSSGEVILTWSEDHEVESVATPRERISVFYSGDSDFPGFIRKTIYPNMRVRQFDGGSRTADPVICGDQIAIPLRSEEGDFLACCQLSGDDINPTNVELVGEHTGIVGVTWDPTPIGDNQPPISCTDGELVFLQDGSGGLYAVDPDSREIVWQYEGSRDILLLGLVEDKILCAWESTELVEITDHYEDGSWDGGNSDEVRVEPAAGHSQKAGILYLSRTSGNQLLSVEMDGTEETSPLLGAITEYRNTHDGSSFTSVNSDGAKPFNNDDGGRFSSFGGLKVARLMDYFAPEADPGETPGEGSAADGLREEVFSTYLVGIDGPSDSTGPGAEYQEAVFPLLDAFEESEVLRLWTALGLRNDPGDWITDELYELSCPLTGSGYVDLGRGKKRFGFTQASPPSSPGFSAVGVPGSGSFDDTTSDDEIDLSEYTSEAAWYTQGAPHTWSFRHQLVWRNTQTETARYKTAAPPHAVGPVASGLGVVVFPASRDFGSNSFVVRRASNLEYLWTFTPPEGVGEQFYGYPWIDATGVHLSWSDASGSYTRIFDAISGDEITDYELPGDMIDQVFDGTQVHDSLGRWAI